MKEERHESRRVTMRGKELEAWHDMGIFIGIWILVFLVALKVLGELRPLLEPLLWAFFIMMGLLPLADFIENLIIWCVNKSRRAVGLGPLQSGCAEAGMLAVATEEPQRSPHHHSDSDDSSADQNSEDEYDSPFDQARLRHKCTGARFIAVIFVMTSFGYCVSHMVALASRSAQNLQENWHHYEDGGAKLKEKLNLTNVFKYSEWKHENIQVTDEVLDAAFEKFREMGQTVIEKAGAGLVRGLSETLMMAGMTFLYMIFWLCNPIYINTDVSNVFRRYILLKGAASAMYAFSLWAGLHILDIDLAACIAMIAFFFNFVPEVGPFLAMVLPVPLIIFDGRIEDTWRRLLLCVGGQLALKFVCGNIVEVKLVEAQNDMKMHPVIILFGVAFFGWIWGPTGMLLSVPIVAAAKASVQAMPSKYRDAILIFLEGDKMAPTHYRLRQNA